MRLEPAKAILQAVGNGEQGEFFPRQYNMNLYRGCSHGCIYCDARSKCYRLESPGEVRAKANALAILREELRKKRRTGIVGLGGMSDGYNPMERTACLTRGALSLLAQYGFGVGITTKSPLVARDIDMLKAIQRNAPAHVTFSITAASDDLSRQLEPGVAPTGERFAAMRAIADAGIPVGVWINPVLPFLTDDEENMHALLHAAAANGAGYVHSYYGMTLREGNREYFYAALDDRFAGIKAKYAQTFGLDYEIASPNAAQLHAILVAFCRQHDLAYTFEAIHRRLMQSGGHRQESLF